VGEVGDLVTVDDRDSVTGLDPGRFGAGSLHHATHPPRRRLFGTVEGAGRLADHHQGHIDQHRGQHEMHGRPGHRHPHTRPEPLLPVGPVLVGGVDRLDVVHPDDLHVRTCRYGLDAVLDLAAPGGPDPRSETQEELGDLHARSAGHDEVAQLVQEDHEHQGQDHHQRPRA
jgi:hypothetical protein